MRRLKVAKEKEGDDYPSLSWRNESWLINGVCVTFVELNVDMLPKVLNPMTSECDERCEINRLRRLREKLHFYIEQSSIDHKCRN